MSKEKNLFELIKNHQYDKLIHLIKSDDKLELNDVDESGTYLIQYAILFRQRDIVALLISKNCKLDILDSEGRSIFYVPIKFGYYEIVGLLINFSNVVVGIPLLEMQDSHLNIPLHYAIMFNRTNIIRDMLQIKSNINYKDKDGNTGLHLIIRTIKSENYDIINLMIEKNMGINHINLNGENALHVAVDIGNIEIANLLLGKKINIDAETINDHLTPLLVASIHGNIPMCELLLKYNPNINCQDIYGNSVINHAIMNKSKQLIDLFHDKIDLNLTNISGNVSINLFFENDIPLDKLSDYKFDYMLAKTKLNIQNNVGKTTWHYLVENDIWENYYEILKTRKNRIFIQDFDGISPYNIIEKKFPNKMSKFIELIANGFLNYVLKHNDDDYKIDIDCIKKLRDLTSDKTTNQSSDKSTNQSSDKSTDKAKCIEIIKKYIVEKHISFPEKKKSYCVNELTYENIKFSSYTGISLDIIMGLIYIKSKFKSLSTSLTSEFLENSKLENYYRLNGIQKGRFSDFLNYEIVWSFQKLFVPTTLKEIINKFKIDPTKKYLIFPVGIELTNGAHANILLYDKEKNEMERFEPYGMDFPPGFNYNPVILDTNLKNLFSNYFEDSGTSDIQNPFKYFGPTDYQSKIGLQLLDTIEYSKQKNIGDPGGFCAAWSLWYVEMRIGNSNVKRNDLIHKLINYIRLKKLSFRSVIRGFTKNITDIRDDLLSKANMDINQWLNDNYTEENWMKLIELIKKSIE
jgi:ankyrin repeat protein